MSIRIVRLPGSNTRGIGPGMALGVVLSLLPNILIAQSAQQTCPYAKNRHDVPIATAPASDNHVSCLIRPAAIPPSSRMIDVRPASEYANTRIPGAENMSVLQLVSRKNSMPQDIVVYDSGRFPSDALQLCDRLRKAGYAQARVLDGGIAGWAQFRRRPESMALSRLSDSEVAAAILVSDNHVTALSNRLQLVLKEHDIATTGRAGTRRILLADPAMPEQAINAQMTGQTHLFLYWLGEADQLHRLLDQQIAMEAKRQAGPAESSICSSL
ncbi:MAG TPA: rhodanese-like domain-containing protein [Xanthomonadaceae bacterium]